MKCGSCKGEHETVAEVRSCYGIKDSNGTALRPNKYAGKCHNCGGYIQAEQGHIEQTAAEGWKVFHNGDCPQIVQGLSGSEARARSGGKPWPDIPAGHYAVKSLTGNQDLDFFRVDRPQEGTWQGRTFVHRIIGGRPDSPVRGATTRSALEAIIAAGIEEARTLYGHKIGRCWKCNRHLTDEESRALGIGPVCRAA